jgi:sugar transferase EpsL
MLKRTFDLAVSLVMIVLLSPVLLVVAGVVRIRMGSPVIFTQRRAGLHGRPFLLYKFRTMINSASAEISTTDDARRLTPLGSFLRRYSLDELPQLANVIAGDLSLVGPRPLLTEYEALYTPEQARRHLVKPGITGWTQIHARNSTNWDEKFRLDTWYVDNRSFWLDLKILLATVKVLRSAGITQTASGDTRFHGSAAQQPGHTPR